MAGAASERWDGFFAGPPLRYVTGFSHAVQGPGQRHQHDSIEIVYHRRGGGSIQVAGEDIAFAEGGTVITPADTAHEQRNDGPGEDVCILLRASRALPPALRRPLHIPRLPQRWLHHELSALADEGGPVHAAEPSWSYRATAVVAALHAAVAATGDVPEAPREDPRMALVCDYIIAHYRDTVSLRALARHVGLSPDRLRHRFVEVHGVGVAAWTRALRVSRAKDLLAHAPLTLAVIARECGLGTDRYLSEVFRAATGMTPGAYRRSLAAGAASQA